MMPMTVAPAIIRLSVIASLVIGLRPRGIAIAWRMTIIGAVAVAVGATAED
jgi:putative exporter of polyketide antibiotics